MKRDKRVLCLVRMSPLKSVFLFNVLRFHWLSVCKGGGEGGVGGGGSDMGFFFFFRQSLYFRRLLSQLSVGARGRWSSGPSS